MTFYRFLSDLWGQTRGWNRWTIRRCVAANARRPAAELAEEARRLFRRRVDHAVALFPRYAEKLRSSCGSVRVGEIPHTNLPIWTRDDQRELFGALSGPPVPGAFVHSTGGSTGTPLRFYVTRESYEWRTAVSDRGYAWAGAEEGRPTLFVWGGPAQPLPARDRWKLRFQWALQRRTYLDTFVFDEAQKRRCCDLINRRRPRAVVGYAGNLVELARFVRNHSCLLQWRPPTLITAAEGLAPGQRELLEQTLGGKVFMSYGSREFMLIGMECAWHTGYHVASDNLWVEVVDERGHVLPAGETGQILVTDLHNDATPFVRYAIGDRGALAPENEPCPCGLPFPRLRRVEGRDQEWIDTPDHGRVTALFLPHLIKEFAWVEGYQIHQSRSETIEVHLMSQRPWTAEDIRPVQKALAEKLGPRMAIEFRRVERLTRNAAGKMPIVVRGDSTG